LIDAGTVRRWLGILHGDTPGYLQIAHTGDWTGKVLPTTDLDRAATYVTQLDAENREGIYLRVTSLTAPPEPGRRGSITDSAALPALWADIDIAGPGHAEQDLPPNEDAGRQVVTLSGLPEPTIWIHSGGGLYPIWLLTEPWLFAGDALEQAKALARDWQRVLEHAAATRGWRYGRGVGDLARVLRIPGTTNRKAGLERPCRIIAATPRRYTVQELQNALAAAMATIAPPAPEPATPSLLNPIQRPAGSITPGDDFAARTSWADILTPAGWTEHYRQDDVTYWTRPGKRTGISASTNALGTDRLHVFTTSAPPLEGGESYSKLGAHAALYFGGDHSAAARTLGRQGFGSPLPDLAAQNRADVEALLGRPLDGRPSDPPAPAPAPTITAGGRGLWTPELDVTNAGAAGDWLRSGAGVDSPEDQGIGRGRLAGFFNRAGQIVHTPREGEQGYVPLPHNHDEDDDGPAQVWAVNDSTLASRVTYTFGCYRVTRDAKGEPIRTQTIFPKAAARLAVDAPDLMPHLRTLRGVVHSPVLRRDGSVLAAPGYDPATGLLHLPEPGLVVPPVPERPTGEQTADAVALLDKMIDGFQFVSKHDRANYLGLLLTPLVRALVPPPYQLGAITAPQPGSGKTLLATCARLIHGGVFRAEMPATDDELRKQITTILEHTTGPIVHIDNVSGTLRSSVIAGLLTSARWDDRRLGANELVTARNDRLWLITGNNLSLGGDLARRTLWVTIDPGVPDPHLRTDFAIKDLEQWTRDNRAALIHALLTITRAWVAAGKPVAAARSSDSYSRWTQTIGGILANAGIEGTFAAAESARQEIGADDDDWHEFLMHVQRVMGDKSWTVKDLLPYINASTLIDNGAIPLDALPAELAEKAGRPGVGVAGIGKSLGRWLRNRDGRWAGGLTVREAGLDRTKVRLWKIHTAGGAR
jgi:hypothetical protein